MKDRKDNLSKRIQTAVPSIFVNFHIFQTNLSHPIFMKWSHSIKYISKLCQKISPYIYRNLISFPCRQSCRKEKNAYRGFFPLIFSGCDMNTGQIILQKIFTKNILFLCLSARNTVKSNRIISTLNNRIILYDVKNILLW